MSSAFDILQPQTETEQIHTTNFRFWGCPKVHFSSKWAPCVSEYVCVCVCESNCSICNFCFSINMLLFLYRCSQLSTTVDTPQTAESVGADAERKRAQSPSQIGWCAACGQQHHGGWGKFTARNRLTYSPHTIHSHPAKPSHMFTIEIWFRFRVGEC